MLEHIKILWSHAGLEQQQRRRLHNHSFGKMNVNANFDCKEDEEKTLFTFQLVITTKKEVPVYKDDDEEDERTLKKTHSE